MFLSRCSAAALADEISAGTLAARLTEQYRHACGYSPGPSEVRSWARSIPAFIGELRAAGLGDVDVLIEYRLPLTSKRVDLIVLGVHPSGGPSCLVVENKQWSRADLTDLPYRLVTVDGWDDKEWLHPQEQARGYVEYLQDFNKFVQAHPAAIRGMVFLHNATAASVASLRAPELAELASVRMFTADERGALRRFLRSRFLPSAAPQVADDFLHAEVGPSKQLLRLVNEELRTGNQFTLLDEQEVAYEVVLRAVERSRRGDNKQVVVVTGGPGSGKSVIAVSLLAELAKRGVNVSHATASRSFTTTLRQVAGRRVRRVGAVFRYFLSFAGTEPNSLEVLIADEAHRLHATSNTRFTRANKRSSLPEVEGLIRVARVPVFLLDEHQVVRPDEIGTVATIRQAAERTGAGVYQIDLDGQFRCGGSQAYVTWVKRLLGLAPGGPVEWVPDDRFRLAVADSPEQLEAALDEQRAQGYSARITAGFCWPWSNPTPQGTLVDDIRIGAWRRPWNLRFDRPLNGVPAASLWATDPNGFGQVGCVYTAQGFEYDCGGVIMGPDLVWRSGHWEANRGASADPKLRPAPNFDLLVRNIYKVLLTRALLGCVIHSTDPETGRLLRGLVSTTP